MDYNTIALWLTALVAAITAFVNAMNHSTLSKRVDAVETKKDGE